MPALRTCDAAGLELPPTAGIDEIKKAFRAQIAKYHPDKVQHLGQEFQAMAADRAAELTEAYRILCDEKKRAEYDASRRDIRSDAVAPTAATTRTATEAYTPPPPPPPVPEEPRAAGGSFTHERATGAAYVKKAMAGRFRAALEAVARDYVPAQVPGFDVACNPKSGFFGRAQGPRLVARYVDRVDAKSIADAWGHAAKALPADEVCVFLMGSSMAPAGELALAINEQRRRTRAARVTLIPVDARDWDAKVPTDAPQVAKSLVARLRTGV